jgi:Skp family chaperone for outer membrane proteins
MKHLRLTIILAAVLFIAAAVPASAQVKIATVNMKLLFNGYAKTAKAEALLDNRKADLKKQITDMAAGFKKAQTDYKTLQTQAADPAISDAERATRNQAVADKATELSNSQAALQQFQRQAESQLADQSQRMSTDLVKEIQQAVSDQAKAGGYTLVLNSGSPESVVFADASIDITTNVLTRLNPVGSVPAAAAVSPLSGISTNLP